PYVNKFYLTNPYFYHRVNFILANIPLSCKPLGNFLKGIAIYIKHWHNICMVLNYNHFRREKMSKVRYEVENNIGIITIDSPPVNVLDKEVIDQLESAIHKVDESVYVVIVTGAGGKAFVAGADIKEFPELSHEEGERLVLRGQGVFNELSQLKQPVIAAIDGFTLGGGLELALACDIRMATEKSTLGLPEVGLGIIPGYGGTQRLPRLVGLGKAMQILLSGQHIKAEEAYRIGLVDEITDGDVMELAKTWASKIASQGPVAVQLAKQIMYEGLEMDLADALKLEAKTFAKVCETEDKVEGVQVFIEKRKANFTGK